MAQYTCIAARLNIRRGPSKTDPIIGVLKRGAHVHAKVRITTHTSTSEPNTSGERTREGQLLAREPRRVRAAHESSWLSHDGGGTRPGWSLIHEGQDQLLQKTTIASCTRTNNSPRGAGRKAASPRSPQRRLGRCKWGSSSSPSQSPCLRKRRTPTGEREAGVAQDLRN